MRACYTELQNYSGEQNYVYLSRMPHREDLFEIILNLDLWFEIFYFFLFLTLVIFLFSGPINAILLEEIISFV